MVTVRDAEHDMVQALEADADDYITKPIRFGELVARLRALIRRTVSADAELKLIQAGNLELDFERRRLRKGGELVHLTPTEFDLLALLMRNQGMPLTHSKLLRTVWGPDYVKNWNICEPTCNRFEIRSKTTPPHPSTS
jgi:two-component system KDP operon response regulator KdpE